MNHLSPRYRLDEASEPTPELIRLRRDGQPPLRFLGSLIARHRGPTGGDAIWHDLAVYRTADAGFAVAIVANLPRDGTSYPACCHAAMFDTLEGAITMLESHDPSRDICPGLSAPAPALTDPAVSPAHLALQAAALRSACHDIGRRYRIAVGAFLAGIAADGTSLRIQS